MQAEMAHRAAHAGRSQLPLIAGSALAVALLLSGSLAQAATPDRCQVDRACKGQTELAAQLASQTRYEEALALYQSAYDRFLEPRLLVNIGRCHYRLGRARKALDFYESFRKADFEPEPELVARVTQFISDAKLAISADSGDTKPGATVEKPAAPEEPKPEPAPAPLAPAKPEQASGTLWGRPTWRVGLGLGALGAGALFVGIGAGALSANGRCVNPSPTSPDLCMGQIREDGQRSALVLDGITPGVPLVVVGSLLAVGGVVLIALPSRSTRSARLNTGSGFALAR